MLLHTQAYLYKKIVVNQYFETRHQNKQMITVYSNDNAVATDRMCGVRSYAQYSIIFPLLLCTENILLDKKAFKSV